MQRNEGMNLDDAKELKDLPVESTRFSRLVAAAKLKGMMPDGIARDKCSVLNSPTARRHAVNLLQQTFGTSEPRT